MQKRGRVNQPAKRGPVYLWTGIGAGKTSSALGVALREVGHGRKAIIVQFMKGRKDIGEYKIAKRLKPQYEIYQFGRRGWVDLHKPSQKDVALAHKGLEFAKQCLKRKPSLLVLDELALALAFKLLHIREVVALIEKVPPQTALYITGRFAPRELMEKSDYVTEFITLKQPKNIKAKKGIEF